MIGTTPVGNAYVFSSVVLCLVGSTLGLFLSLLGRVGRYWLLNVRQWECLWCDLALFLFNEEGFGELSEDNSSSAEVSMLLGTMGFFPLLRTVGCFALLLSYMSFSPRLRLSST